MGVTVGGWNRQDPTRDRDRLAPAILRGVPESLALKWTLFLTAYTVVGVVGVVGVGLVELWSPSADARSSGIVLGAAAVLLVLARLWPPAELPASRMVVLGTAFAGRVLFALGFLVLLGLPEAVITGIQHGHRAALPIALTLAAALLGPLLLARGDLMWRTALRNLDPSIITPPDLSDAPFALYLRSFDADLALAQPQPPSLVGRPLRAFAAGATEETHLGAALSPLGPLLAVGAPGESVPPLGATRMYLPAEAWQEPVRDLMRRARAVILVLGAGAGSNWELRQAIELVAPQCLLVVVPIDRSDYERWRDGAGLPAKVRLPEFRGQRTIVSRIQGLIHFSAQPVGGDARAAARRPDPLLASARCARGCARAVLRAAARLRAQLRDVSLP